VTRLSIYCLSTLFFLSAFFNAGAQTNYFADGYHGGIYGHYPMWVTKFITDTLQHHKDWKVNLEIEPETWDTIEVRDPLNYEAFKKVINNSSLETPVEYVNPSYAQSYLYNISGESIIRQFQYGMKKLKEHFPLISFTTYSSEEPCFTSALPQILKSLGFKYVVLKNPNTCWGGYVKAYGGESVNWIGPDGTSILTVPRYSSEALQKKSTWQTIACDNSNTYINAALNQGIKNPVGMCFQDAGWRNGPWLGNHRSSTQYTTWRNYFKLIEHDKAPDWRLSQEDIDVSLVWGSQILQRIAQEVRSAENKILAAEKIASLARLYADVPYPQKGFDEAWRTLLLSEHHDCWIVPYNMHQGKTWADHVKEWTAYTAAISDSITKNSLDLLSKVSHKKVKSKIIALNTKAEKRNEIIGITLPEKTSKNISISKNGKVIASQLIINKDSSKTLLFKARVPALGYATFSILNATDRSSLNGAYIVKQQDGSYKMETNLYKLIIDPEHGGRIKQLLAKEMENKNFVSSLGMHGFNTLRGNFYNEGGFKTSDQSKTKITVLENGPLRIKLEIEGNIGENNFIQTIQLTQDEKLIDCSLHIDYKKNVGIGEDYKQHGGYNSTDLHKAFYNDTNKLLAVFPLNLQNQKVYKDAPFDVTYSNLSNTFYNKWDSIKNNVIDNWVDVTDGDNKYGMALLSDHVTSYSHGENFPLALTIQYAGIGLWGRNYSIKGPTDIHYALLPHKGKWNKAQINKETIKWNELIITSIVDDKSDSKCFVESLDSGLSISAMYYKGDDLYVRILNNASDKKKHQVVFNCYAVSLRPSTSKSNSIVI
jgi:alpha-mannosidase